MYVIEVFEYVLITAYLLVLQRPVSVEAEAAHTDHLLGVHLADGVAELIGDCSARCNKTDQSNTGLNSLTSFVYLFLLTWINIT